MLKLLALILIENGLIVDFVGSRVELYDTPERAGLHIFDRCDLTVPLVVEESDPANMVYRVDLNGRAYWIPWYMAVAGGESDLPSLSADSRAGFVRSNSVRGIGEGAGVSVRRPSDCAGESE